MKVKLFPSESPRETLGDAPGETSEDMFCSLVSTTSDIHVFYHFSFFLIWPTLQLWPFASLDTPPKRIENTIFSDCAICLQEHVGY